MLSYRSRGTLMSHSDHSAQRCFKSNTPQGFSCIENYEAVVAAKFCAASGCDKTQAGSQCKHHWTLERPLELLVNICKNTDIFI